MLQSSSVVGVIPLIDLTGVPRSSIMFCLRKWMISIGLCNLLGMEGVVVVGDWLLEGQQEHWAPQVVVCWASVLGGRPA